LRKDSTYQIIAPAIAFAVIVHFVFKQVFLAEISLPWLLIVLGIQCVIFAFWAFEQTTNSYTITGAALVVLIVNGFAIVLTSVRTGSMTSPGFIGGAFSIAIAVAALYSSYHLATSPGYWFSHRITASGSHETDLDSLEAKPEPDHKPTEPHIEQIVPLSASAPQRTAPNFRIIHHRTTELLLTCPCEQVEKIMDLRTLQRLLPDFEPDSVCVIKIGWTDEDTVDIHVDGTTRSTANGHYTLLNLEE